MSSTERAGPAGAAADRDRMSGSIQDAEDAEDAEDAVQETFKPAWTLGKCHDWAGGG
jgi:hypothetical protein